MRYCNTEQSVLGQCDLVSIVLPVRNDVHRNWASYINRSAGVFVNHNRVSPSSSVAYTLLWRLEPVSCFCSGGFFFFFFFLGGRAIHYTYMDMQRKKPQVSNGRPSTAEAASYPQYLGRGRHKSLQRGNMSGKTSSPQGSCPPAHSQACSFSTNKASPLSESTQHSCQDHNLKST